MKASPAVCDCCGRSRGFEYAASFYTRQTPKPTLCPWCIASGEAAKKYNGKFSDEHPLRCADIPEEIIQEVCERNPGFSSWQQEVWQTHCGDACEFHGDVKRSELRASSKAALTGLVPLNGMNDSQWQSLLQRYEEGGNPAVYKFVCRHCHTPIYHLDFT